jgi:hypothetical protein
MTDKLLLLLKTRAYKVKDVPGHTMKAYGWIRSVAPLILNLSSRWK